MFRWIRERFNPKPARPTREKVPELLITARQIIFEEPLPQPKPLPPPEPPPEAFTKSARRRRIEAAEAALPPSAPPAAELAAMLSLRQVDISEEEEDRVDQVCTIVRERLAISRPELASFPAIALRVVAILEQPEISVDKLAGTIGQDAAISAALLRVANSAYYSRGIPVNNVRTAIMHVGLATVASLAAGIAGKALYDAQLAKEYAFYKSRWDDLFHRSMTIALGSGALAMQLGHGGADRAFAGGMFHDVGKTMALRVLTGLMLKGKIPFELSSRMIDSVLDRLHVSLGVEMAREWKLPDYVIDICQRHHDHDLEVGPATREIHIVRLVSGLNALRASPDLDSPQAVEVRHSIAALNLGRDAFLRISSQLRDFAQKVTALFDVRDSADDASPFDAVGAPGGVTPADVAKDDRKITHQRFSLR